MAITKINADAMDLTDAYAFTGTVTGAGGGKVLQVVIGSKTAATTYSPGSSWVEVTGLSAAITPASASNKILVVASLNWSGHIDSYVATARLYRNGSHISAAGGTDNGSRPGAFLVAGFQDYEWGWSNYGRQQTPGYYLDSPNSTSTQTYKLYVRDTGNDRQINVNRGYYDINSGLAPVGYSTIVLMEVKG
mgnify:CR=1 FL=1